VDKPHWYVVQAQVNGEMKAARNLLRQGFDVYLPRYLKRRQHARKIDFVAKPLFPRYLFVAIDLATQRWRSILSTQGVSHLVCHGDEPTALSGGVLDGLRAREDARGFVTIGTKPEFAYGDRVRVTSGTFANSFGLFDSAADDDRVAILLDLLGRKVRTRMDANLIAAA
jgi:transcriptional antiterminator RfaH